MSSDDLADLRDQFKVRNVKIREALGILNGGGGNGPLDEAFYWLDLLLEASINTCPLQKEDRVELIRTPVITPNKSTGWMHAKHFLIAGAKATVKSTTMNRDGFIVKLAFDEESWIDHAGVQHPADNKALYAFHITSVRKIADGAEPLAKEP